MHFKMCFSKKFNIYLMFNVLKFGSNTMFGLALLYNITSNCFSTAGGPLGPQLGGGDNPMKSTLQHMTP